MAWRNLWRNVRRTLITLSSIALGTMLAIVLTGIQDSSYGRMIDLAARTGGGHVTLEHPAYLDAPSLDLTIAGASKLRETALAQPHVVDAVPRIVGETMLATARRNYGAYFIGIDPELESPRTLAILDDIVEGEPLTGPDDKGILVGATLAKNLRVKLHDKVVYTLTNERGEIVSGLARVSGIVRTGSPTVDASMCVLSIGVLREVLGYDPDEAIEVAVFADKERNTSAVEAALAAAVGPDVATPSWRQTQPDLAAFIAVDGGSGVVFEIIVLVLVAAGILNALFVSVMERRREFGILMAIGVHPRQISTLVVWESLWLALIGMVAGALVTIWPYWYLHTHGADYTEALEGTEISGVVMDPVLYTDIQPYKLWLIVGAVVVTTLLAGLYPAWRASRVVPVDAIKLV
jgi:ABC-type lipoprotein release transport system permease subunit